MNTPIPRVPLLRREQADGGCQPDSPCCPGPIPRRTFIKVAGLGTAAASAAKGLTAIAGPFDKSDTADHFVSADKKLSKQWIAGLTAKGQRTWYQGKDLETIGMPVGGLCAGQLYLAGDGRLVCWYIFNETNFSGYGQNNYEVGRKPAEGLRQGFALRVEAEGKPIVRALNCEGFPGVRFCGEYPIGFVEYDDKAVPVSVALEAFSPFVPLDAPDSALPATVMQFTLKNKTDKPLGVTLAGWLENGVCWVSGREMSGSRTYSPITRDGLTMLLGRAKAAPAAQGPRPPIVVADFEGKDYGEWKAEGQAFGTAPAQGTLANQQPVSGFQGKGLVNTFLGGDAPHGKLTSPALKIERNFLSFLIGGGNHKGKTCINLLVDGRVVRTAEGTSNEKLQWHNWDVRELAGKEARIEIVDQESAAWGHVNIDQIELRDVPRSPRSGPLDQQGDFGTMGLALLDSGEGALSSPALPDGPLPEKLFGPDGGLAGSDQAERPFAQALVGAVGKKLMLAAGAEAKVAFAVAWHFPNRTEVGQRRGNFYATRFKDAAEVAAHLAANLDRLSAQTRLWHKTWYDSTLPHWLLDRLFSTVSTLATGTCQWWADGRFWAWEGVGCCHGTCAHVWNYEHGMARLFPQLERSVREMQDFNPEAGFDAQTGAIRFRGEGWKMWAGDSQPGTVLKALREHQCSKDGAFLKRNWPRIRKALEFLFVQDGDRDGLIEGEQHNTYDINFYGANTMVGSLYLAACRAAEEMARELGDNEFAATCRKVFESGSRLTVEKLYNGEYFIQQVDLKKHPKHQYADGCLADQLFGQGWAHQTGLGYVYPKEKVAAALQSIWKYCWTPDVAAQNKAHPPQRWFARPGEGGLFTCTWPKSKHLGPESVLYRDEVWTGIEYQVAGNMVWDGMLTEALAICRAVHERYHPSKHNPFNEIECGDHYARGMAAHGVFLALCGFEYHGPKGRLGFAPRITPDDFRAAFTGAEGWGTIAQKRAAGKQTQQVEVLWGKLAVKMLAFELAEGAKVQESKAAVAGKPVAAEAKQEGSRVVVTLAQPVTVQTGEQLEVVLTT